MLDEGDALVVQLGTVSDFFVRESLNETADEARNRLNTAVFSLNLGGRGVRGVTDYIFRPPAVRNVAMKRVIILSFAPHKLARRSH